MRGYKDILIKLSKYIKNIELELESEINIKNIINNLPKNTNLSKLILTHEETARIFKLPKSIKEIEIHKGYPHMDYFKLKFPNIKISHPVNF